MVSVSKKVFIVYCCNSTNSVSIEKKNAFHTVVIALIVSVSNNIFVAYFCHHTEKTEKASLGPPYSLLSYSINCKMYFLKNE